MREVICLGILVADVIGRPIDEAPPRGTLQVVPSITPHIGGCAANTGIALQTLGVQTTVVGKVGRDGFGDFVHAELDRAGVETQIARDGQTPTSATMVLVSSDAERSFLHCIGANATFSSADFDTSLLKGVKLLHIAGHGLMPRFDGAQCARLLQTAREMGVQTSLDTAGAPDQTWRANLRQCLPHLDYFVPSLHEVAELFPDSPAPHDLATQFLNEGVGVVALKMGERGSLVCTREGQWNVPSFGVDAVDATGAGDAFAAGFLAGVLRGFDWEKCARLGNAAGALCVTRVGTVDGILPLQDTLDWIEKQ